jgi:hypothetical protein
MFRFNKGIFFFFMLCLFLNADGVPVQNSIIKLAQGNPADIQPEPINIPPIYRPNKPYDRLQQPGEQTTRTDNEYTPMPHSEMSEDVLMGDKDLYNEDLREISPF